MSKRISNNFIKELVASSDIYDVVSRFVSLKKSGKNYKGCCPFHNEKTPSFYVNVDKNYFHCFGCQESGDSLAFVKKINNIEFIDSVKNLADIVGKTVEYENHSKEDILQEQIYAKCISFLQIAQKYYRWNLGNDIGRNYAIQYLKNRGVDSNIAKFFGIGYSSDRWDSIVTLSKSAKISNDVLLQTGLVVKNDNGHVYDRFRERIMFPIRNIQGNVIAYGGRVIDGDGVKYLNSSESIVFQKSDVIYGLYECRQMKKLNKTHASLVVVEGYMDVIGLASSGFYGAVATLGTAFSKSHAKILFRESSDIVLCFDGDNAGKKAAMRTIKIVLPILDANKKLKILTLKDNKDPDDYIKFFGLESFKNAVDNAVPVMEFLTDDFISDKNLNMASSKSEVLESLKTFLHDVDDNIYSESLICTIADKVGIKPEQVKKIINTKSQVSQNNQLLSTTNIVQKKLSKNLLLEQKLLSEVFINIHDFQLLLKNTAYEIFPTSINLEILLKCLKIIKQDPSSDLETVILIQILTDDYPDYREYFFDMLSYGIENTQKKDDGDEYTKQIINMLERVERNSIKQQLKYLGSIPFRTEVQNMEQKYLVGKLSV